MDDFSALIEAFRIGGTPLALVAAFVMWLRTSASAPGAIKKSLEDRIDAHEKRLTEKIEKQGAELRGSAGGGADIAAPGVLFGVQPERRVAVPARVCWSRASHLELGAAADRLKAGLDEHVGLADRHPLFVGQ